MVFFLVAMVQSAHHYTKQPEVTPAGSPPPGIIFTAKARHRTTADTHAAVSKAVLREMEVAAINYAVVGGFGCRTRVWRAFRTWRPVSEPVGLMLPLSPDTLQARPSPQETPGAGGRRLENLGANRYLRQFESRPKFQGEQASRSCARKTALAGGF
ncbi:hypothetical protein C1879_03990 [Paraeggerthella hongkongensis]|nr:hypothetical protein C1879_03990 [Paraeggerthella hongkongensis]